VNSSSKQFSTSSFGFLAELKEANSFYASSFQNRLLVVIFCFDAHTHNRNHPRGEKHLTQSHSSAHPPSKPIAALALVKVLPLGVFIPLPMRTSWNIAIFGPEKTTFFYRKK
jgi:hypothetical protein